MPAMEFAPAIPPARADADFSRGVLAPICRRYGADLDSRPSLGRAVATSSDMRYFSSGRLSQFVLGPKIGRVDGQFP